MADHEIAGLGCPDVADLAPAFVLGALEPAEIDAVRRHLASCPEAHAEFAELGSVVPALFETVELVVPPDGLKARILAAAAADTQRTADLQRVVDTQSVAGTQPGVDVQRTPDVPRVERAPEVTRPRPIAEERSRGWSADLFRRPVWAAVALAAALAVVALGAWNLQLRDELADLTAYRNGVAEVLDQAAEPGARLAVLTPPEGSGPSGLAAVASDGRVGVVMRDLAPTAGAQVYETWLIGADGNPVAIGGFTVDRSGTATFATAQESVPDDVVVALTLEPQAGMTAPTGPVVAAGEAQPRSQSS